MKHLHRVRIGDRQAGGQGSQRCPICQQLVQGFVLIPGKGVGRPHFIRRFWRDGDVQDIFRPAIIVITARMVYRLHPRGDLRHIPEHGGQTVHPVCVQRGNIHAILRAGGLGGKDSQHLRPVRGLPLDVDAVIVAGLQFLQLCVVGNIYLRHRFGHRHRVRCTALRSEEQAEGRACHGRDDDNDCQRRQNNAPAYQTGQCGDQSCDGTAEQPGGSS